MTRISVVYAVFWPSLNAVKVGVTQQKRYRKFLKLGGELLGIKDSFAPGTGPYDFEQACQTALSEVCRFIFRSAAEAVPYLGGSGGGYRECFDIPGDIQPWEILDFIDSRLEVFHAPSIAEHMPVGNAPEQYTHVTHALTQNYSPREPVVTLGNAHRGADGFALSGGGKHA